jgi:protein PsiE
MKDHIPKSIAQPLSQLINWVASILLVIIAMATVFCIGEELLTMFNNRHVSLSDLLLLFIYLEILAMVEQYLIFGKIPVRYPIYITIIAIARYLLLGMKTMDTEHIINLAAAMFILTLSTTLMRLGHHYWPYKKMPNES